MSFLASTSEFKQERRFLFYLLKADFFSERISFNFHESNKLNSYSGAFLTILVIVFSSALCFVFGKNVYERTTPNVSESSDFINISKIESSSLFFFFNFRLYGGKEFPKAFDYLSIQSMAIETNDGIASPPRIKEFIYELCQESHFLKVKEKLDSNNIDYSQYVNTTFYCINIPSDFSFWNPLGNANSLVQRYNVQMCDNTIEENDCPIDQNEVLKLFFMDFKFIDNYEDTSDYSNPVKYYINSFATQLTNKFSKRTNISFINALFQTVKGWLFEDIADSKYVSYIGKETDVNGLTDSTLFVMTFMSPQITKKYFRYYNKIQDLFAKVGGFINGIIIFLKIITLDYFEFSYLMTINSLITNEKENKKKRKMCDLSKRVNDYNDDFDFRKSSVNTNKQYSAKLDDNKPVDEKTYENYINNNINRTQKNNFIENNIFPKNKLISINNLNTKLSNSNNKKVSHSSFYFSKQNMLTKANKLSDKEEIANNNTKTINTMEQLNYINKANKANKDNNNNLKNDNNNKVTEENAKSFKFNEANSYMLSSADNNIKNDIKELKITNSIYSYIKYRLSYILCCMNDKRKLIINKIKEDTFEFMSIQKELSDKL